MASKRRANSTSLLSLPKEYKVYHCETEDYTYPKRPRLFVMKKGKFSKSYFLAFCGFDIETTNIVDEEHKAAYMYHWQLSVFTEEEAVVYLGRTWETCYQCIAGLCSTWGVNDRDRMIVWDANFGFEFQFIMHRFEWSEGEFDFFAKEHRKPLLATTFGGCEFREALSISGGGLAQLAKDFCKTQKLVGDLDYSILRNSKTPLTKQEEAYCINDVVILAEFSYFMFKTYIIPDKKIPLTKTGLLRRETKLRCKASCNRFKTRKTDMFEQYLRVLQEAFPSEQAYKLWFRWLFRGGFVHGNIIYADQVIHNVGQRDETSAYPTMMNLQYYPTTKFMEVEFDEKYLSTHCCIMYVEFTGIESTTSHSIESENKIIYHDGRFVKDNGRMSSCSGKVRVLLTELDFETYKEFYTWKSMKVLQFAVAKRGRLPHYILDVLNEHYKAKNDLKLSGQSDTPEYAIAKASVNSAYGLMCTRIRLEGVTYSNKLGWTKKDNKVDYNKEVEKQVLLPQWGIWVAAHARRALLSTVYRLTKEVGDIVVYCDTDSIKYINTEPEKINKIFDEYNQKLLEKKKQLNMDLSLFDTLGEWDDEGTSDAEHDYQIKCLGAKRYLIKYPDGHYKATIAGLPKATIKALGSDPFENFTSRGFELTPEESLKLTTSYADKPHGDWVDGEYMEELSSCTLYPIKFKLKLSPDYVAELLKIAYTHQKSLKTSL